MKKAAFRATALFGVFGILFAMFNGAAAAQLGVVPEHVLQTVSDERCTDINIGSTTDSSGVLTITNIPNVCFGLPIVAHTVASSPESALLFTGAVANAATVSFFTSPTIPSPAAVTDIRILIGGWLMNSSWDYVAPPPPPSTGPIVPSPNTPGITVTNSWTQLAPNQFCVDITITTTSTTPIPWAATVSINPPPFNGADRANQYVIGPNNWYRFAGGNTAVNGQFTLEARQPTQSTVVAGSPRVINVCNYNTPPPQISTNPNVVYTVTQSNLTPAPSFYPCKTVTVSVTGAPQFFVGWEAIVSVADLRANYATTGGSVKGPFGNFSRTAVGTDTFRILPTGVDTQGVKNDTSRSFQICWGA